ncbi:uncharacterized protein KZ484_025975 [Pholidichthys leucotaenia]
MMAAAGCGSATAAAVGSQGGTATARGRFPGRPWSSRSRLRSEKRWQLGRSGLEADDVTNGGPRPAANLALTLNEDPSHIRLLGLEANHKILGQAGYSSSGSEEGDDFRGFEAVRKSSKVPCSTQQNSSKGYAVNTKSKRQSEKQSLRTPAVKAPPPDHVKQAPSFEEIHSVSLETKPEKDCKKGLKGKDTDRQSTKSRASSAAPRITIKLVAKKKIKTVKEPHQKSAKKLKIKEIQDQPKAKDIEDDHVLSAHIKLKTEPPENATEDKGGGTVPTRRRGRSAFKTADTICQTSAKIVGKDQKSKEKESADQIDLSQEDVATEPKLNARKLKQKNTVSGKDSPVTKLVTRRSNRVTNPLSTRLSANGTEPESICASGTILAETKSEVSQTIESKPLVGSSKRRQSRRLNKVPENQGSSSTESDNLSVRPSEGLPLKNEEMRVPSLKLIRIRNPKYGAQASGKNSSRKKKRKKFIWTLTLVKSGSQAPVAEKSVKDSAETVSAVDQCVHESIVTKNVKKTDKKSKLDSTAPQESKNTGCNRKKSQNEPDVSLKEMSNSEVEVQHVSEMPPQEISKTDCEKVVPPLQIKKVSSPGKRKSSKPSFLVQQVNPAHEKKEDSLKDQSSSTGFRS